MLQVAHIIYKCVYTNNSIIYIILYISGEREGDSWLYFKKNVWKEKKERIKTSHQVWEVNSIRHSLSDSLSIMGNTLWPYEPFLASTASLFWKRQSLPGFKERNLRCNAELQITIILFCHLLKRKWEELNGEKYSWRSLNEKRMWEEMRGRNRTLGSEVETASDWLLAILPSWWQLGCLFFPPRDVEESNKKLAYSD